MKQTERSLDILCIGASIVDMNFYLAGPPLLHTSNPGILKKSAGGVVRNIAHHLSQLGTNVELITIFGNDAEGKWLEEECRKAGIGLQYVRWTDEPTDLYTAVVAPDGELFIGTVSSESDRFLNRELLAAYSFLLKTTKLVLADCNLSAETLKWLIAECERQDVPLIVETVSVAKAERLNAALPGKLFLVKPNRDELEMFGKESDSYYSSEERIEFLHRQGVRYVWLGKGPEGSQFSDGIRSTEIPATNVRMKSDTGAGDAAVAGWIWAYLQGKDPVECVRFGHAAAAAILDSEGATREDFSQQVLEKYF